MSIKSVMPSSHLILCRPLRLPPSVFPNIRVFSNKPVLHIRWPKYWSFSFSISPSSECSGLISFRMDWLDLLAVQGTLKSVFVCKTQCEKSPRAHGFFCVFQNRGSLSPFLVPAVQTAGQPALGWACPPPNSSRGWGRILASGSHRLVSDLGSDSSVPCGPCTGWLQSQFAHL